jgi:NitT/TauT family transport system substrate-binding protein
MSSPQLVPMTMLNRRAALLAGGAFALTAGRAAAQTPALTPLHVASTANDDITAALYALSADLFVKAGLDVQLSTLTSGSAISAAVVGGALDIGRSSMLPLISARSRGFALQLVAPAGLYLAAAPVSALVVPASSSIRTASDLSGKVVSVPALGDLDSVGLRNWIDANGGDSKSTQYVEMPGTAVVSELSGGRVAAGTLQNPFMAQALKGGTVRVLGYHISSIGPRLLQSSWFSTSPFVQKNAAVVRAFAGVMQAASAYCNSHQARTAELLASFTKMDPATIAGMSRVTFASNLDPTQIQPLIDVAAKYRTIDKAFDAHDFIARLS